MSQNQLIVILTLVLLLVIIGSIAILMQTSFDSVTPTNMSTDNLPAAPSGINLEVLGRQTYQLLNKQLIKEGALPVAPPVTSGKANPFL